MQAGFCHCSAKIFFGNTKCLGCGALIGRCSACRKLTSFSVADKGSLICDRASCQIAVGECKNRKIGVCDGMVCAGKSNDLVCHWCSFTDLIPNLEKPENLQRWAELEGAKRRLLVQLDELQLPPYNSDPIWTKPLRFKFMEDTDDGEGNFLRVYTGHADGVITINVLEADSVYREMVRSELKEPQRTIIGHLRHEYGHYLDWCLGAEKPSNYTSLFGDPKLVDYELAKQSYYLNGPASDWKARAVSPYATMHPWEDFAETVNVYLDIMAIAETAIDQKWLSVDQKALYSIDKIVYETLAVSIAVSEFNFDLGLPALLPKNFAAPVMEKLAYIHSIRSMK